MKWFFYYNNLTSSPPVITSSLTTFCTFPFSISTSVRAFYIPFFYQLCLYFFHNGYQGFGHFLTWYLDTLPSISLWMLEASTTLPGFPSWLGNTFVISLFVVIVDLLFFFFFSTSRIALTSTIIFSFLLWFFFLIPIDSSLWGSHCFKK